MDFLNHGSFGATPRPVLEHQAELRAEMERQPVEFLWRRLPGMLAEARERAAGFLGADPGGFAWVRNATTGVATVLESLDLEPGDEVVRTDHVYPAVANALRWRCERSGAVAVVAEIPLPLPTNRGIVDAVLGATGPRTRLVIVEQVTSPTAAILPVVDVIAACHERGIPVLVDGAHAPGMLPIDLHLIGADWWTRNFHKWVCSPKSAGALVAAPERRAGLRPLVTSHGFGQGLQAEFDWTGTDDPTAFLSVPPAIEFLEGLGWDRVRQHDHDLAAHGQRAVAEALGTAPPVPPDRFGSMALAGLPEGVGTTKEAAERLQAELYKGARIEVPFVSWNGRGFVRLSAQVYNHPGQYDRLASELTRLVDRSR